MLGFCEMKARGEGRICKRGLTVLDVKIWFSDVKKLTVRSVMYGLIEEEEVYMSDSQFFC